jgi:hypothetical protein
MLFGLSNQEGSHKQNVLHVSGRRDDTVMVEKLEGRKESAWKTYV